MSNTFSLDSQYALKLGDLGPKILHRNESPCR